ncbi:MAG TPA: hypothetical protein VNY05_05185 [Candidatus Acidoferrales bacterium]|nr:hypothetical protein [Candidatus Acidoferrales bacterium]
MLKQWSCYSVVLAAFASPLMLRSQEQPLSINGIFSTGYYNTTTRGEASQSLSFVPVGARFEMSGYYHSPDLLSFSAQPELNFGPQASDAGFQGGNGIKFRFTLLRKSIAPLTFRYSNVQVEDAYFGSLTQISGYTLKNRTKDLGVTWEFKPKGLPATTFDFGTGSVDSKSATAGIPDYLSHGNHLNVDSKFERWGWDLQGFLRRNQQESDLSAPVDGGTQTGTLRDTVMQYQGSARRGFLGDSELHLDAGSQSTSSLLFTLPIDLSTRYVSANLRLMQKRRWKTSLRANYSSNIASQLLEQAASSLIGPGAVVPDANVLVPFSHGIANLSLNAITSVSLGHGFGLYGSVERSAVFSSSQGGPLNSNYFTATAGVTYAQKFFWGNLSGEYARELGTGSLIGQSGTIQGQHYSISAQHGGSGGLQFDATVRGSQQIIHTVQPLTNNSFSAEGSVADRVAGSFSARLGGGWQWGSIVNAANEFRTNGYTARASIESPRVQISASLNNSLSNSLPFYNQLLDPLGAGSVLAVPLQIVPSDYRATSFTLHTNPLPKVELSASWTRSSQHLDGFASNTFELLNVFATYHFRRLQLEAGLIRSNQSFLNYPYTVRQRFYVRVVRGVKIL